MLCNDPFLTYLKSFGYNVIRLPKADIKPLQILVRQGKDLERLGDLVTLLVAGTNITLPPIAENTRAANISGQRTSDLNIGTGLSIMSGIISAMGGSKLGLDIKYQQAKTVTFEFQDVYEDKIEILKLDQYLTDADISPFSSHVRELLDADDLYVTTATIKSTKFAVEAKKSDSTALELNLPEIQGVVGGNVKVSGTGAVITKVTYESPVPLIFGFQAVRLSYDQGRYTAFEPLATGGVAMRSLANVPADRTTRLMTEGAFISLASI